MPDQTKVKRDGEKFSKGYLLIYNVASAALWAYVLVRALQSLAKTGDYTQTFSNAAKDLVWIQPIATLEIFHALLGLVRSPILTTSAQVFSRLLLSVGILYFFPTKTVTQHWAVTTMTIAWSVTEVIRYLTYAFGLVRKAPNFLVWCRYSFFYVLYPMGVSSEVLVIYQALPIIKKAAPHFYYSLIAALLIYPIGFYQLFTYMIKQRSKALGFKAKKMA